MGKVLYLADFKPELILKKAGRLVASGNLMKAINEYLRYLKIRPQDLKSRQKLAELYARIDMDEAACKHYLIVAEGFADDGFFLKALAVYKQLILIDPMNPEFHLRCADINLSQGLIGNAVSEYRLLIVLHRKLGENKKADQLQKMIEELFPDESATLHSSEIEDGDFIFDDVNRGEFSFDDGEFFVEDFDFEDPDD